METDESNLYYCIIVKYTKARVFLVICTDRNDFPCFCGE